jgi:hypothetical protein
MRKPLLLGALLFSFGLSAQRLEVGATTSAAIGIGYGTFYDIRPMIAWGKSFESVRRFRLDRTSMNFSNYNDQSYFSLNTGMFFGQQWRKQIADKFYFVHGPEAGANYYAGTNYQSYSLGAHYRFGGAYRFNEKLTVAVEAPISFEHSWASTSSTGSNSSSYFSMFGSSNIVSFTYALR